jgi:hypothetical protein
VNIKYKNTIEKAISVVFDGVQNIQENLGTKGN